MSSIILDMLEEDSLEPLGFTLGEPQGGSTLCQGEGTQRRDSLGSSCDPTEPMSLYSLLTDVSESSSDDDLIFKLSHDLELPMALDDLDPVSSWSSEPKDLFQSFSNDGISAPHNYDGDFTADELTRALYPNLEAGPGLDSQIGEGIRVGRLVKEEPNSPQHLVQMPPSPDEPLDVWELLLCGTDVKPNIKAPDTPPVTPPQSHGSPPHSPQPPMVAPFGPKKAANEAVPKKVSQPIKVVTITTKNGSPGATKGGRVTKTMKIQPKVVTTTSNQVISIVNNSSAKMTLPKTALPRALPSAGTRIVQVKAPPQGTTKALRAPFSSILTTQIGSPCPSPLAPLAPALAPGIKHDNTPDLKALKRQQRMIKNRESASLSRKRKKEYLTSLEGNLNELHNQNQKLKEENLRLQQRVTSLEKECAGLRHSASRGPSRKTTTALFALIFLFSLNLGPLSSVLLGSPSKLKTLLRGADAPSPSLGHPQRSLLWAREDLPEEGPQEQMSTNASHTCPMYINATESLRLETELRGWFGPRASDKRREERPRTTSHPKTKVGRNGLALKRVVPDRVVSPVSALAPQLSARLYRYPDVLHVDSKSEDETAVSTSSGTLQRLSSFLEAIERRDDTYYVVSFSPDHLLVPAVARNDSARPRMSLLVPTRPLNDSLAPPPKGGEGHVSMMQIDCQVVHTRMVRVDQEVVPVHLRWNATKRRETTRDASRKG